MLMFYLQMIETKEDKSKFEILYEEYRGLMRHVAFDVLHNEDDAEDAVHHAFVKIIENIKKIDDPKCHKTKSYVVTIVERKAIDMYRTKSRHPQSLFSEDVVGLEVEYDGSFDLALCLSQLPPRYRQVLTMKYHLELSNKEIAKLMDISEANVRKLAQRAREKLFELYETEEKQ